jgi:hypothetical protein
MENSDEMACRVALEFTPRMIANIIHMVSNLPLLAIPVLAILSLGIKDHRDRYGVATIVFLGAVSITAALWRILDAKLSGYTSGHSIPLAKRNGYIIGTMLMVLSIQLAYSLPQLRLLLRSTFAGTDGPGGTRGSGKGSVPTVRDSWVIFREPWVEDDSTSKTSDTILLSNARR